MQIIGNVLLSSPLRPKLSFPHFVIEPVVLYEKSIDYQVLYESYHICIFMKINKNVKSEEKRGKTISIARYRIYYKTYLASLRQSIKAISVIRETFLTP